MNVLIVHAHPEPRSFNAALTERATQELMDAGHEVVLSDLYRMGWVLDYADPSSILDVVFSPKSAFQYTGWQSADYEKLLADAAAEPRPRLDAGGIVEVGRQRTAR